MTRYNNLGLDEMHKIDRNWVLIIMVVSAINMFYFFLTLNILQGTIMFLIIMGLGSSKRYLDFSEVTNN